MLQVEPTQISVCLVSHVHGNSTVQ